MDGNISINDTVWDEIAKNNTFSKRELADVIFSGDIADSDYKYRNITSNLFV